MFNIVELAPPTDASKRLNELITTLLKNIGIRKYMLKQEKSEVYGSTIDILIDGVEVATAVAGPNALDRNWNITEPWAGVGFGVERLAMATRKFNSVARVGRSLVYLNGARLDIE
jgi:phenylalanyl-tRNA synthetase alpha chain